ncbi:MAG: hypothetical protein U1E14_01660 [Geminicoccaceae bacterium]
MTIGTWLVRDLARDARWKLASVVVSGTATIATKFAAMAVIYVGVSSLSGHVPSIPYFNLADLEPTTLLFGSVVAGTLLLTVTAQLRYDVRRRSVALGRAYTEICMRRVIALVSRLPHPAAPEASRMLADEPPQVYLGYCRLSAYCAREVVQLLPVAASFVLSCFVLIWLDWVLTIGVGILATLGFAAQYPATHSAVQLSRQWERSRRDSGQKVADFLARLRRDPVLLSPDSREVDGLFGSGALRDNLDLIAERSMVSESATLASRVASGLLLGGVVLMVGFQIQAGTRSWAAVAAYLAAVRFTLGDFVSLSRLAASLGRSHAQIERFLLFLEAGKPAMADDGGLHAAPMLPLRVTLPGPQREVETLELAAGTRVGLGGVMPGRVGLGNLLIEHCPLGNAYVPPVEVTDGALDSTVSLRTNFLLDASVDEAELARQLLPFLPKGATTDWATAGWMDRLPASRWEAEIPRWALRALHILAVRARRVPVVCISAGLVGQMPASWRVAAFDALKDSLVVLVYSDLGQAGRHGDTVALLVEGKKLACWARVPLGAAELADLRAGRFGSNGVIEESEEEEETI